MVMRGSSMPKAEYDLMAIMYSAYGIHHIHTSNIRYNFVGNKIVDNSDVVGALPVSTAPTTSSFSTEHLFLMD